MIYDTHNFTFETLVPLELINRLNEKIKNEMNEENKLNDIYQKFFGPPSILEPEIISEFECSDMYARKAYIINGKTMRIGLNQQIQFPEITHGQITRFGICSRLCRSGLTSRPVIVKT